MPGVSYRSTAHTSKYHITSPVINGLAPEFAMVRHDGSNLSLVKLVIIFRKASTFHFANKLLQLLSQYKATASYCHWYWCFAADLFQDKLRFHSLVWCFVRLLYYFRIYMPSFRHMLIHAYYHTPRAALRAFSPPLDLWLPRINDGRWHFSYGHFIIFHVTTLSLLLYSHWPHSWFRQLYS
jgi:hypothetical protein